MNSSTQSLVMTSDVVPTQVETKDAGAHKVNTTYYSVAAILERSSLSAANIKLNE